MGFSIEMPEKGGAVVGVRGNLVPAAVDCWFTSYGQSIPRMVKFQGEEGEICRIRNFWVQDFESLHLAGTPLWKYTCRGESDGRVLRFCLYFYPEDGSWKIVFG